MVTKAKRGKPSIRKSAPKPPPADKHSDHPKSESWQDLPRSKWNPWFVKLYEYCQAKPGAWEDHPWDDIVFKFGEPGKVFAFLGHPSRSGVCVKATEEDFDPLMSMPFVKLASYIGRFGWVVISVSDAKTLKIALDGIDKSYDQIAAKSPGRRKARAKS